MSSKSLNYSSYGNIVDGTSYCSGMETLAENLIEDSESDAVLVYPSREGWASLRSSGYRLTTDNAEAILPLPIYKIKRMLLRPAQEKVTIQVGKNIDGYEVRVELEVNISEFKDENGQSLELDITDMIVSEDEWNSLPLASSIDEYKTKIVKDNTFFWRKGENIIPFLGTVYKFHGFVGNDFFLFVDDSPTYARLLAKLEKDLERNTYIYTYPSSESNLGSDQRFNLFEEFGTSAFIWSEDIRTRQFRIEYVPMTSKTKLRARKAAPTTVDYMQPFNQRAEINAASAFGKNMYLTAQKTGVKQITLVRNYTHLADIPPLGALVRHNGKRYRLVANSYKQTNTVYMQVTHTLSENWTSKSKHISVDQKYRNWKIPQDTLWRNLYWEDFVFVSDELQELNLMIENKPSVKLIDIVRLFNVDKSDDSTIDSMVWDRNYPSLKGVFVPCSTYGIGNSMVISASMQDNLSAGLSRTVVDDEYLCEEALYCNEDGTLDDVYIYLSDGVTNGDYSLSNGTTEPTDETEKEILETFARNYAPQSNESVVVTSGDTTLVKSINTPKKVLFGNLFTIYKDAGEAIRFTYQVHFTPCGNVFVGNKIAENNPLIKRWDKNREFRVWICKKPIREGADVFVPGEEDISYSHTTDGQYFTISAVSMTEAELEKYGETYHFLLGQDIYEKMQSEGFVAWCITDESNNLYLANNDGTNPLVYLQMAHKR